MFNVNANINCIKIRIDYAKQRELRVNITELLTEQREGLAAFGKALQDCVEVLQPAGHPLRKDITPQQPTQPQAPQQPAVQPVTPPTAVEVVKSAQTAATAATAVVQPAAQPAVSASIPVPVAAVKSGPNKIGELKDGDKQVTVTGKVIIINAERKTSTGKRVAECVIGDDTGTIRLSLWESHIDLVKEGSVVSVKKGYVTSFQEKTVLNVGQWGTLKVEAPP